MGIKNFFKNVFSSQRDEEVDMLIHMDDFEEEPQVTQPEDLYSVEEIESVEDEEKEQDTPSIDELIDSFKTEETYVEMCDDMNANFIPDYLE